MSVNNIVYMGIHFRFKSEKIGGRNGKCTRSVYTKYAYMI